MALCEARGELKLPVVCHIDAGRNMDGPGLPGPKRALKGFPETPSIGHAPATGFDIAQKPSTPANLLAKARRYRPA